MDSVLTENLKGIIFSSWHFLQKSAEIHEKKVILKSKYRNFLLFGGKFLFI